MLNTCDACQAKFCIACLQPEKHDCPKLSEKISDQVATLSAVMQKLDSDKGLGAS